MTAESRTFMFGGRQFRSIDPFVLIFPCINDDNGKKGILLSAYIDILNSYVVIFIWKHSGVTPACSSLEF